MRKSILLKGPVLTRSGYGEQARFALRSLRSRMDIFDIYIQPITWGTTSWITDDTEERRWIDQTIEKTIAHIRQGGGFDISLQVTIPNEWEQLAPTNIGYTAGIETTKTCHTWIEKANMMNNIIVVSNHSKDTFNNSKYVLMNEQTKQQQGELSLNTTINAVNYPVKTFDNLPNLDLNLDYDFNFLSIAQFGPRKNLSNTIKWFVEEFKDEKVGLVVKTNIAKNCLMDRDRIHNDLKRLLLPYSDRQCKVYLIHGDMTDEEIHSLYTHSKIKAFLALPHGEGFGLPIFEAAYSGIPVVATGWSGQLDFLVDESGMEQFYNVAFDLQPVQDEVVWENVLIKESMWAYPREQSAKQKMRLCYNQYSSSDEKIQKVVDAQNYANALKKRFTAEKMYASFVAATGLDEDSFDVEAWIDNLNIETIE
jgi:glycosyltransferase involved in cell wall biosynthesis